MTNYIVRMQLFSEKINDSCIYFMIPLSMFLYIEIYLHLD